MKRNWLILLVLVATAAGAEDKLVPSRKLSQFGVMTSWGNDAGFSGQNWGASYRSFEYFDGSRGEGSYYSLLSGALFHVIDGQSLADLRVLNFGWRGNPFRFFGAASPFDFTLDLGVSPVMELRLAKKALALEGESVGLGGTIGFYIPCGDAYDLGFSWEPVIDLKLMRWGSSYRDPTYADFVVYWVFKSAKESRNTAWQ